LKFKATPRDSGNIILVDISGEITLGEGSSRLRELLRDLLAKGNNRIVLNLGDVDYIDSSGIGELVSGFNSVRNRGGELKLLHLSRKVQDLLLITKLYTVFDVHSDETTAVRSFL
jgi:anti-sigma B factor antagonist